MTRIRELILAIALFAVFHVGMSMQAWWDFTHPQAWESAGQDPQVYVWAVVASWLVSICVFGSIIRNEYKMAWRARLAALLVQAEELVRQRRGEEAEAVLKECQAILNKVKSA